MRSFDRNALFLSVLTALSVFDSELIAAPAVRGDYVETRLSPRRSLRSLLGLDAGRRNDPLLGGDSGGTVAVLGWNVGTGSWNGVTLDKLSVVLVVAAVDELETLHDGDGTTREDPVTTREDPVTGNPAIRAVLYVDQRASEEQQEALIALAVELAPRYANAAEKIRRRKITYQREKGVATLSVGDRFAVTTRPVTTGPGGPHHGHHEKGEGVLDSVESHQSCSSVCGGAGEDRAGLSLHTRVDCAAVTVGSVRSPQGRRSGQNGLTGSFSL